MVVTVVLSEEHRGVEWGLAETTKQAGCQAVVCRGCVGCETCNRITLDEALTTQSRQY